jgi:hypothetical protein
MVLNRRGFAEARLQLRSAELLSAGTPVEVSLDCGTCSRRLRTVVFTQVGATGICTPTGHQFIGQLDALQANRNIIRAEFRYEFEPFEDVKYGDARYQGFEPGAPTWARLTFHLHCLACGLETRGSTQSNIVRPWSAACQCGAPLYDDVESPMLGWTDQ